MRELRSCVEKQLHYVWKFRGKRGVEGKKGRVNESRGEQLSLHLIWIFQKLSRGKENTYPSPLFGYFKN